MPTNPFTIRLLSSNDVHMMEAMLTMFGDAFEDVNTYNSARPDSTYLVAYCAESISLRSSR